MNHLFEGITPEHLFGKGSRHIAFNYVVQEAGGNSNRAAIVGNTCYAKEMSFDGLGNKTHTLVMCDAIIRPRLVVVSDHLRGAGITGILTTGLADIQQWAEHGEVIYCADPEVAKQIMPGRSRGCSRHP